MLYWQLRWCKCWTCSSCGQTKSLSERESGWEKERERERGWKVCSRPGLSEPLAQCVCWDLPLNSLSAVRCVSRPAVLIYTFSAHSNPSEKSPQSTDLSESLRRFKKSNKLVLAVCLWGADVQTLVVYTCLCFSVATAFRLSPFVYKSFLKRPYPTHSIYVKDYTVCFLLYSIMYFNFILKTSK